MPSSWASNFKLRPTSGQKLFFCAALIAAVLALLLHQTLFFGKGLIPGANPLLSDQYLDFIPLRYFFYSRVKLGEFPLWNPFILCGVPSVAAIQTALLFPLNLIFSRVDPFFSAGITAFLRLWICGFFTLLYMRRIGAGWSAAALAALTFSLSGYMIVWLGHPQTNCACLFPALLWLLDVSLASEHARPWAAFSFCFGAMILGGHPPTIIHITLVLAGYLLVKIAGRRPLNPVKALKAIGRFTLASLAGALLAAPQLLPYFEYLRLSATRQSAEALERWSTHLSIGTLTHFFIPNVSGNPTVGFEYLSALLGLGPNDNFNERTGYVGLIALFLAAVAILYRRDRSARFFFGLLAVSFATAYGLPPIPEAIHHIPILNAMNHSRMLLFVCFSLAVLAGFGLDGLGELYAKSRREAALLCLGVFCGMLFLWVRAVLGPFAGQMMDAEKYFLIHQMPIVIGGFLAAGACAWFSSAKHRSWAIGIGLAWTAFDLLWFGMGYNPAITREQFYPANDAVKLLMEDPSMFRVAGLGRVMLPDTAIMRGLYDIRGQDFTGLSRYEELITGKSGDFSFYTEAPSLPPSLPLLNVKYVLTPEHWEMPDRRLKLIHPGSINVYQNPDFAARAILVPDYRLLATRDAVLERVRSRDFRPSSVVLLEGAPPASPETHGPIDSKAKRSLEITDYRPDHISIRASTPEASFLVLFDSFYPGWSASINGNPTKIFRADYDFRAIFLPAGQSDVQFDFNPLSFNLGIAFCISACLALGWIAFKNYRTA